MPFHSRVLGALAALAVLPLFIWIGRYSRWSEVAYRVAAAKSASEELAERRRIAAEQQLEESKKPKPPPRSWRPEIATRAPFPKLEVDGTTFDFGTIRVGEQRCHVFHLKNAGQAPLILRSAPHCGERFPWSERELQVGESLEYVAECQSKYAIPNFGE
jgi:hypothetical protein